MYLEYHLQLHEEGRCHFITALIPEQSALQQLLQSVWFRICTSVRLSVHILNEEYEI